MSRNLITRLDIVNHMRLIPYACRLNSTRKFSGVVMTSPIKVFDFNYLFASFFKQKRNRINPAQKRMARERMVC